jgi:predicted phosphodiesterase
VNPSRCLVAGDTHGDTAWLARLADLAVANDAARVVVCGDFGYWAHTGEGRQFLRDVAGIVASACLEPLVFVDGNHEQHSSHPAKPPHRRTGLSELTPRPDGFVEINPDVLHAPRGHRWR